MEDNDNITITGAFRLKVIKSHLNQSDKIQKALVYTCDGGKFTSDQRDFYEKNGFVVVKNLVSPEKLDKYKDRFREICSKRVEVPYMTVMKDVTIAKSEYTEGEKAITKIQDFCHDDELFEYC